MVDEQSLWIRCFFVAAGGQLKLHQFDPDLVAGTSVRTRKNAHRGIAGPVMVEGGTERNLFAVIDPSVIVPGHLRLGATFNRIAEATGAHVHAVTAQKPSRHLHHVRLLDQLEYGLTEHQELAGQPIEPLWRIGARPAIVVFRLKPVDLSHPTFTEGSGDEEKAMRLDYIEWAKKQPWNQEEDTSNE